MSVNATSDSEEVTRAMNDTRHYSQLLWDDLFEFVQLVTCSDHPTSSKIRWLDYVD